MKTAQAMPKTKINLVAWFAMVFVFAGCADLENRNSRSKFGNRNAFEFENASHQISFSPTLFSSSLNECPGEDSQFHLSLGERTSSNQPQALQLSIDIGGALPEVGRSYSLNQHPDTPHWEGYDPGTEKSTTAGGEDKEKNKLVLSLEGNSTVTISLDRIRFNGVISSADSNSTNSVTQPELRSASVQFLSFPSPAGESVEVIVKLNLKDGEVLSGRIRGTSHYTQGCLQIPELVLEN